MQGLVLLDLEYVVHVSKDKWQSEFFLQFVQKSTASLPGYPPSYPSSYPPSYVPG